MLLVVFTAGIFHLPGNTADNLLQGQYDIVLSGGSAGKQNLGSLAVDANGKHQLRLNEALFGDYFLSMRPFRCMDGGMGGTLWCHLPYPYEKPPSIAVNDLRSLEYDLLFIHRSATEYGIDAWNGLYFELKTDEHGIVGRLREVDLNVLASPPENGVVWPIAQSDLHEVDAQRHLYADIHVVKK